jgi:addiction module HigA family antidote
MTKLPPMHPGEVLREEFLEPLGLKPYTLAARIGVPRTRVERIAKEETGITVDTALRLGAYFHTTPEFWMNLQNRFELETARRDREVVRELDRIERAA